MCICIINNQSNILVKRALKKTILNIKKNILEEIKTNFKIFEISLWLIVRQINCIILSLMRYIRK